MLIELIVEYIIRNVFIQSQLIVYFVCIFGGTVHTRDGVLEAMALASRRLEDNWSCPWPWPWGPSPWPWPWPRKTSGGSRKKYLGGLAPHHLGGNHG